MLIYGSLSNSEECQNEMNEQDYVTQFILK